MDLIDSGRFLSPAATIPGEQTTQRTAKGETERLPFEDLPICCVGSLLRCRLISASTSEAGSPASYVRSVALRPALASSLPFSADTPALPRFRLRPTSSSLNQQGALKGLGGDQLFLQQYIAEKLLRELRLL